MNQLINIDFNKAKQQADRLEAVANELETLTQNDYVAAMEQVRNSWRGESSDLFMTKGGMLENELNETVKRIRQVVSNLRSRITAVENAQKIAQEIIRQKNT